MTPDARDLGWMHDHHTAQLQYYVMCIKQEKGQNENSCVAGHTVIDKSSRYSSSDVSETTTMAQSCIRKPQLHVRHHDAQTDTDNLLPAIARMDQPLLTSNMNEIPITFRGQCQTKFGCFRITVILIEPRSGIVVDSGVFIQLGCTFEPSTCSGPS